MAKLEDCQSGDWFTSEEGHNHRPLVARMFLAPTTEKYRWRWWYLFEKGVGAVKPGSWLVVYNDAEMSHMLANMRRLDADEVTLFALAYPDMAAAQ